MKIIRKIEKRNEKLVIEPIFEKDKVILLNFKELLPVGTEWEFKSIGEPYSINKTDKKGKPMYVQNVKAEKIITYEKVSDALFIKEKNKWSIPVYSGDVFIRNEEKDGEIKYVINDYSRNLGCEMWNEYSDKDNYICKKEKVYEYLYPNPKPDWMPENIYNEVITRCEKFIKKINDIREKEVQIKEKQKELLEVNKEITYSSFKELLHDFLIYGVIHIDEVCYCPGTDYRSFYYGHEFCLFKINELVYDLGVIELDEDYINYGGSLRSNIGEIKEEEIKKFLRRAALFAIHPNPEKVIFHVFNSSLPKEEVIYAESVHIHVNENEDDIVKNFKLKEEEVKKNFASEVVNININNLIFINAISYLDLNTTVEIDIEEGIGMKSDTYYETKLIKSYAIKKWKINYEIRDEVCNQVRSAIVKVLSK